MAVLPIVFHACVVYEKWLFLALQAFDCSSMISIEQHAGLTSLGTGAFAGCSSLTSIALPAGFDDSLLISATVPEGTILRFASLNV